MHHLVGQSVVPLKDGRVNLFNTIGDRALNPLSPSSSRPKRIRRFLKSTQTTTPYHLCTPRSQTMRLFHRDVPPTPNITLNLNATSTDQSGNSSRSNSEYRSSFASSAGSSDTSSTSEDSWTGSMEARFRQMITSEQGRKMLAGEVEALTARQVRRVKQHSARGGLE